MPHQLLHALQPHCRHIIGVRPKRPAPHSCDRHVALPSGDFGAGKSGGASLCKYYRGLLIEATDIDVLYRNQQNEGPHSDFSTGFTHQKPEMSVKGGFC